LLGQVAGIEEVKPKPRGGSLWAVVMTGIPL